MNNQRKLHQILLRPTDVLFFRDGRPMGGSLAGHTAAWPLPDVTNHALHAALHRAGLAGVHGHDHHRADGSVAKDARKFGSLLTAGPFPVFVGRAPASGTASGASPEARWFFPRPKDAQQSATVAVTLRPVRSLTDQHDDPWLASSLPDPLEYAVANTQPPSKDAGGEPWLSTTAYERYLRDPSDPPDPSDLLTDTALADTEYAVGIGIDPATGTTGHGDAAGQIYTAHYLRLREGWRLGVFAECLDKINGNPANKRDLVAALLNGKPQSIIVGGQQRLCTAERKDAPVPLPLPRGLSAKADFKPLPNGKYAVKWILLTPALWPEMRGDGITPHPGGWLPNWVFINWDSEKREARDDDRNGNVLLKAGDIERGEGEGRETWRRRVRNMSAIPARLVAAIVPKPVAVTGWALSIESGSSEISHLPSEIRAAGAKSTHLAVPAGAVYYFEADTPEAAKAVAAALNWHGPPSDLSDRSDPSDFATIKNRRSTLLGEKGYGLGVCGTWQFYEQSIQSV
ncbi:MAG: type III-B CRISPR module-associated Cmr3 family protein [Limisphaerales bacterium]